MKVKDIKELLTTDVVLETGLFCVQSYWQGEGNQYNFMLG
jgi:hypothetical protein